MSPAVKLFSIYVLALASQETNTNVMEMNVRQKLMNANYGFFVFALTLRDLFYYNSAHLSHVITKVDYIKTPHT